MRRILLALLLLTTWGCGATTTPKPVVAPSTDMPLAVSVYPQIVMAYSTFVMKCRLPTNVGEGLYFHGISGITHSAGPIDKRVYTREMEAPCGQTLNLYCGYQEYVLGSGLGKPQSVSMQVEVHGECR